MGTVTNISIAADKKKRLEAYHLCESILFIYEHIFTDDIRLRMAVVGAKDFTTGLINDKQLKEYQRIAQMVVDDAAKVAVENGADIAWRIHPAVMVAGAVLLTLDQEIDLCAVQHKANEALKYAFEKA